MRMNIIADYDYSSLQILNLIWKKHFPVHIVRCPRRGCSEWAMEAGTAC